MADQSLDSPAELEADLRKLGRFARTRLAANDHHLVVADRPRDLRALRTEGKVGREFRQRKVGAALGEILRAEAGAQCSAFRRSGVRRALGAGLDWLRHAREFTQAAAGGPRALSPRHPAEASL